MEEEHVGVITHYWPKAQAAGIDLDHLNLQVGDHIRIEGHGHNFIQPVVSIEVDHERHTTAHPKERAAIHVERPVHKNDDIYLVRESAPKE